jgi:hypothetical protein
VVRRYCGYRSAVRHHPPEGWHINRSDQAPLSQVTFLARAFFGQDVAKFGLLAFDLARCGEFEPLLSGALGF